MKRFQAQAHHEGCMHTRTIQLLIPLALLLLATPRVEADSMRCGQQLVSYGDSRSKVRARCGKPTDIETRSILRRPTYNLNGRTLFFGDGFVEIQVEVWTYNLGPYKLMRQVRFVDGRIDEITTLGYGYHED